MRESTLTTHRVRAIAPTPIRPFRTRRGRWGSSKTVVNPRAVIHALDKDGMLGMREHGQEPVGTNSKFVFVRPDQSHEEVFRIPRCLFEPRYNSSRDLAIQPL